MSNATGVVSNEQGFVTDRYYDTNPWEFTTNWFQCFDIDLTNGLNEGSLNGFLILTGVALPQFWWTTNSRRRERRQRQAEGRAFAGVALHVNHAMMFQRNALADGQPQARAVFLVVKNGSNKRSRFSGAMPTPVS